MYLNKYYLKILMVYEQTDDRLKVSGDFRNALIKSGDTQFWNDYHEIDDYNNVFRFDGLARKGASKFIDDLSSYLYTTNNTNFEQLRENEVDFDNKLNEATTEAYVGGVGMLYLAFRDNQDLDQPATPMVPDFLQSIPSRQIERDVNKKAKFENDLYTIIQDDGTSIKIHKSRVLLVCINKHQRSELEKCMRALDSLSSIAWANAQSFWRMAAGITHLKIQEPEMIKNSEGVVMDEVEAARRSGILSNMDSKTSFISDARYDIDVKGKNGAKMNPQEHFDIAITILALSFRVPKQIFLGENAGQISGSENNIRDYVAEIMKNRKKFQVNLIHKFAEKIGLPKFEVELQSVWELSPIEKINNLKTAGEAIKVNREAGVEPTNVVEFVNKTLGLELKVGELPKTPNISNDSGCPCGCESKYNTDNSDMPETILDNKNVQTVETRIVNRLPKFIEELDFSQIEKVIRGSIFFKKFKTDAEQEGFIVVDQQVDKIDSTMRIYMSSQLPRAFDTAYLAAQGLTKQTEQSERTKEIKNFINERSFNNVKGVTDDMRKDLKRVLTDSIINERNPREAVKAFEAYVSEDFTKAYKNRLRVIANQETITVFNEAAVNQYLDAGVEKHEWITAGDDRVRPLHQQANGSIVKIGQKFPFVNVTNAPAGVRCRCTTIPVLE